VPGALAGAFLVFVAACAATDIATNSPTGATTATAPDWLDLTLRYSPRHSLGKRRLDVVTTNNGRDDIVVTEITLHAEHFDELPPEAKTSQIMSGLTVAVKADFGEVVDCAIPGPLEASVALSLLIGESKSERQFDIPVDPAPLDVIRANDCNTALANEAVDLSFAEEWAMEDGAVATDLIVSRGQGDEAIVVDSVRGMILYGMEAVSQKGDVVAILDPEDDELSIPVRLTLARCDVHAVSQAPDGYSFRVWVGVGEREPILATVKPNDALQEELEDIVLDCMDSAISG
jgi:hypothetical protein